MVFRLVPRGADRAPDPAVRQVVDGHDLRREHRRHAVRHAGHERSEAHARRLSRQAGQERPGLHRRTARIRVERLEMIEDPDALDPGVLGESRPRHDLVPRELMLGDVEAEPHTALPVVDRCVRAGV